MTLGIVIILIGYYLVTRHVFSHIIFLLQYFCSLKGNENPFLGDMICVCAGFSYAVLSVGQEFMIKGTLSVLEFMAMLSFSGAVITGIQL